MTDENNPYELPRPDMGVFGPDESGEPGEGATPTEQFAAPGAVPAGDGPEHPHGTVRFQDPGSTHPRQPSLGEQRARQRAEQEEREHEIEEQEATAHKAKVRKRLMIGGGVVVGVAAIIGAWYLLTPDTVNAECTANGGAANGTIVQDQYCDSDYMSSHGGYISNGIIFYPIVGGGYRQYHYYYGGSGGSIGQRATGGSYSAPENATVKTKSGSTVQRGGLGVSSKSGSGSGSGSGSHSGSGSGGGGEEEGGSSGHTGHSGGS